MDLTRSFLGEIREIVRRETRYLRHYWAEVVDTADEMDKGRVLVTIPALGWDTNEKGAWALPRDRHSMKVPSVGEHVEVYFLEGDVNKPVYFGTVHEIADNTPANYTGDPKTRILYQDKDTGAYIQYDSTTGILSFFDENGLEAWKYDGGRITWIEGTEAFVLGDQMNSFLSSLVTALNSHVHTGVTTGGGTSGAPPAPFSSPSGLLSADIKGK